MEENECNDDESYNLTEPQDFDAYTQLIQSGEATHEHHEEFYLRVINHFCASIQANKMPKAWVLHAISDAFTKVTMGGRWEDELPLPWTKSSSPWTEAQQKDIKIFCEVANTLKSNPSSNVTDIIKKVASNNAVSYEKARSAYYSRRGWIE